MEGPLQHTLSKHDERFPASCRARSRRRSYSASASPLVEWLKAVTQISIHFQGNKLAGLAVSI
jgi:hypothetical protein